MHRFFLASLVVSNAAYAVAQPACPFDASQPEILGGQVFYFDGRVPQPLSDAPLQARQGQHLALYYVVKSSQDRSGALVIKTAQLGPSASTAKNVDLSREAAKNVCDPGKQNGFHGSVTTRSYSDFHDRGKKRPYPDERDDWRQLNNFHTLYTGANNQCRGTSDKRGPNNTYLAQNNRSQFSFDTSVVDHGLADGPATIVEAKITRLSSGLTTTAYANVLNLQKRHAEIKLYQTSSGYACVPFNIVVHGAMQVVRVNDLENRDVYFNPAAEFRFGPTVGGGP